MRHIKHSSMWVGLVIILPLFWEGITCQVYAGYSINVPRSVSVQEGLCVTIPCNFTANYRNTFSNSFGYWRLLINNNPSTIVASNDKSSPGTRTNFNLTGNPDSGDCSLTITDARKGDAGTYCFRFEESKTGTVRLNYNNPYVTPIITVPDLTEEPVISDPGTVIAGINKTLTCTPPVNCSVTSLVIQWKKSNVAGVWENSSTVTFTPSLNDVQESITCEMTNARGKTTQRTILLHVYSPPAITITWVINGCVSEKNIDKAASIKVDEGSSVTLICLLQSNLTLNVTWMDGKNDVLQHGNGTELELRLGNVTISHTSTYTCSALNEYVMNFTSINVTVQRRSTNPEMTDSSEDTISYRDIAIAFICGMSTPILIFLLYKLITRKKMTKEVIYLTAEEPSASTERPKEDIYMNIKKPKEKLEVHGEATDNNMQLDSGGVTKDEDNLHYSTILFSAKSSKGPSSQPETEYAEVKGK